MPSLLNLLLASFLTVSPLPSPAVQAAAAKPEVPSAAKEAQGSASPPPCSRNKRNKLSG